MVSIVAHKLESEVGIVVIHDYTAKLIFWEEIHKSITLYLWEILMEDIAIIVW